MPSRLFTFLLLTNVTTGNGNDEGKKAKATPVATAIHYRLLERDRRRGFLDGADTYLGRQGF